MINEKVIVLIQKPIIINANNEPKTHSLVKKVGNCCNFIQMYYQKMKEPKKYKHK